MPTIQQLIDAGKDVVLPEADTRLDVPVFLRTGSRVRGATSKSKLIATGGTAFVSGWRRTGLITPDQFSGGYRTKGVSYLSSGRGGIDLGPAAGGWAALKRLEIGVTAVLHSSPQGTWSGLPVCGINSKDWEVMPYGPVPCPWMWYFETAANVFSVRTSDGTVRRFRVAGLPGQQLSAKWVIDFDQADPKKRVRYLVNNTDQTVDDSDAGPGWVAGLRFCDNFVWPLTVGRLDPLANSDYWGAGGNPQFVYDATFSLYTLTGTKNDGSAWNVSTSFGTPVDPKTPDAVPLVSINSTDGTKWLYTIHKDQFQGPEGEKDVVADVELEGFTADGPGMAPFVINGRTMGNGGFKMYRVKVTHFSRAVSGAFANVNYPLTVLDCDFEAQYDCAADLTWVTQGLISNTPLSIPGRAFLRLLGGDLLLENSVLTPATGSTYKHAIYQEGGLGWYRRLNINFEGASAPPAVVFRYNTWVFSQHHPSGVICESVDPGSAPGASPLVRVMKIKPFSSPPACVPLIDVSRTIDVRRAVVTFDDPADEGLVTKIGHPAAFVPV